MKFKFSTLIVILTVISFVSCKQNKKKEEKDVHLHNDAVHTLKKDSKKNCKEVHWTHHQGEEGPANWKNLCDGFSDCGGKAQSPINIDTNHIVNGVESKPIKVQYARSKVSIVNNGHTVQFNVSKGNNAILDDKEYKLLQFHYHSPSEHMIDGQHFPLEVHFVHQHSDSDYAVIGVIFKEGSENVLLQKYLDFFPKSKGQYNSEEEIDLESLLPMDKSYYRYNGSLTTPPCSEVVNWYVLRTPITASKEQIEKFSSILKGNYRPVQPINDRVVTLYK